MLNGDAIVSRLASKNVRELAHESTRDEEGEESNKSRVVGDGRSCFVTKIGIASLRSHEWIE
jgi:hypothetical protein